MGKVSLHRFVGWYGGTMRRWIRLALLFLGFLLLPSLWGFAQACPTVVVIIPETVTIHQVPRHIPDPAAETAIIHHFLDYGFHVVDQNQIRAIRYTKLVSNAIAGQQAALLELSDRFAADILVLGEAFAEETEVPGQLELQSARSRVELRAIESATGKILAADALHTGGIDLTLETAAKKALQRAGDGIACQLAKAIVQHLPPACATVTTCAVHKKMGVTPFQNQSGFWVRGWDVRQGLATMVETALSKRGLEVVHPMASDIVVSGVVSDWKVIMTPVIQIPFLDLLFRAGVMEMTVDMRLFNLETSEIRADVATASVTGFEVLGMRFGLNPRGLARKVATQIADRAVRLSQS